MEPSNAPLLSALAVFKNILNEELIRTFHVYKLEDDEYAKEREFLFSPCNYIEMESQPLLKLSRDQFSELFEGKVIGPWLCMLLFDTNHGHHSTPIPSILEISRNPKLKSVPSLARDLEKVYQLGRGAETMELFVDKEFCKDGNDDSHPSGSGLPVLDQDLNCLPNVDSTPSSSGTGTEQDDHCVPGEDKDKKKKKRASTEHIAKLVLEDLVKYFDLPIAEASKNLSVGLTVLKRRCRELGIPRWPHRKIKSLDSLIHNLQEEAARQEGENRAAAMAVLKRQKIFESEKESIKRQPFIDIQNETRRFRQNIFKRRHRARALIKKSQ